MLRSQRVPQINPTLRRQRRPKFIVGHKTTFTDRNFLELSTSYLSNKIQIPTGGALTISGGILSINGGTYTTTGTAVAGDIIRLQATSSASYETAVDVVLSVDAAEYDTWTLTTAAEKSDGYIIDGDDFIVDGADYIVDMGVMSFIDGAENLLVDGSGFYLSSPGA